MVKYEYIYNNNFFFFSVYSISLYNFRIKAHEYILMHASYQQQEVTVLPTILLPYYYNYPWLWYSKLSRLFLDKKIFSRCGVSKSNSTESFRKLRLTIRPILQGGNCNNLMWFSVSSGGWYLLTGLVKAETCDHSRVKVLGVDGAGCVRISNERFESFTKIRSR